MDREYNFIIFLEVLYGDKFYYNAALKKKLPFPHQFLYIINNFGEGGNSCKLNIDCKLVWGRFCIHQRHIYPLLFPEDGSLNTSWVDKNSSFVLKIEKDKRKWKT